MESSHTGQSQCGQILPYRKTAAQPFLEGEELGGKRGRSRVNESFESVWRPWSRAIVWSFWSFWCRLVPFEDME